MKNTYDDYDFERLYSDVNGYGFDDYSYTTPRKATYDTYNGSFDGNYDEWN